MQTLTFTQKLLRQRRFLSALIPLLAIFIGLGASQTAQAQVTITSTNVFVQRNGGATETFNVRPSIPMPFDGANLGSYDINTGQLVLKGGSVTTNQTGTTRAVGAAMNYAVYDANFNLLTSASITLQGGVLSSGNRTYSNSTQTIDLVSISRPAGAGTPYYLAVDFSTTQATGFIPSPGPVDNNNGNGYAAAYSITGAVVPPTGISNSDVFINTTGAITPNTTYGASSSNTPRFQGANLGTYNVNTGQLTLNGGNATTFESNGDVVQNARLVYQVIKPSQNGQSAVLFPASNIALVQTSATTDANNNTTRRFSYSTALRNLINGLANSGIGTFNLNVSFESDVLTAASTVFQVRDNNGGTSYVATFSTIGVPVQTATWTGNVNDNWFNAGNWDLGRIPDANTNVVVPDFGTGNTKPYPNISAGTVVYVLDSNSQPTTTVRYDNTNSGPAMSRNLNLLGSTQAQRTILRLITGRLQVYGDFANLQDSFIQRSGSVFELAGGNQSFTGGSNFDAVEISGGGTKNLTGTMTVTSRFTFVGTGGVVTTDVSRVNSNFIQFSDRSTSAPNGAQLQGETETSYIRGFVLTNRSNVLANEVDASGQPYLRSYSGLGLQPYFTGANNPGDVLITRNTAESYTPLVTNSSGTTARYGIRRIFGVRPSSPNTNNGGLLADVTFTYRDAELVGLGPDGMGSISEPNLGLFVSTSGGNQFGLLGRDALDQANNKLFKSNVRTFATFTLGDLTRPLPVSLTALDAKRVGADAVVTWETAIEKDSRGYDVQVSTDGKEFRTLGFVASKSPNSIMPQSYTYVDVEKSKVGVRYYRLRQVDLDGKETFFGPRTVSFDGKVTEGTVMTAYPNPFNNADQLHLNLQSAQNGAASLTIVDMTGRIVRQQKVSILTGSNDVTVDRLNDLKAGLYQVRFVLPSGEVRNLKVMKQ